MTMSLLVAKLVPLYLIHLKNVPIYEQLQLEEALLRADVANWCVINTGSPPAIVMGISGKVEKLINQERLNNSQVPVIRRFSGGGTVFIDPNTIFISWICNTADSGVKCCPLTLHQWTATIYEEIFPSLGIKLVENDYVIGKHKVGGNAQYMRKDRWLHHTSLLWDYNSENMDYLTMPGKIPEYRENRSHDDFLCRLCDHFEDVESCQKQLLEGIHARFQVKIPERELLLEILDRPHRKGLSFITA